MDRLAEAHGTHRHLGEELPKLRCREWAGVGRDHADEQPDARGRRGPAERTAMGDRPAALCRTAAGGDGLQAGARAEPVIETLGDAKANGWRVTARCAWGKRDAGKSRHLPDDGAPCNLSRCLVVRSWRSYPSSPMSLFRVAVTLIALCLPLAACVDTIARTPYNHGPTAKYRCDRFTPGGDIVGYSCGHKLYPSSN